MGGSSLHSLPAMNATTETTATTGQTDTTTSRSRRVPTYCYQCVAGPDLLTVKVENGVATEVEPNFCAAEVHQIGRASCRERV